MSKYLIPIVFMLLPTLVFILSVPGGCGSTSRHGDRGKYIITTSKGVIYKSNNLYTVGDCIVFSVEHLSEPMKLCSDYKVEHK